MLTKIDRREYITKKAMKISVGCVLSALSAYVGVREIHFIQLTLRYMSPVVGLVMRKER